MLAVTWTNDAQGRSVFWLRAAVRHGIWPSVDDQLGITPKGIVRFFWLHFRDQKPRFRSSCPLFKRHADVT
jgi:hypothetical protein